MTLRLPALDPSTLTPRTTSTYPEVFQERVLPREKRPLGLALGLTQFGVNLTTLSPGKASSLRHYHSHEEEFVYVLEGEVVLRTDEGEQTLTAGTCAGFRAGTTNGHQLVNRGAVPAKYLEVGSRHADDRAKYPEDDLSCEKNEEGSWVFSHRDGTPW
ncbi:MAG: cupin [Archangium gephyra]|uniref:Cupin n=1 Tax=Archangium gephyra TaxID=48 RepID=A0A2W5SXV4_9BACT|nr:MAG: cupin [Archangium gephyra]